VRVPLEPDLEPLVSQWLREYKLRSFGSVALHLAFAALGAALWDLAAGAAILLEAGGRITSPAGDPLFPFDVVSYRGGAVPFLAGNPLVHAAGARSYRALVEPVRAREW
jgi:fructose-1,6-bisphosphatase/inositol monophosphatase family enzyme